LSFGIGSSVRISSHGFDTNLSIGNFPETSSVIKDIVRVLPQQGKRLKVDQLADKINQRSKTTNEAVLGVTNQIAIPGVDRFDREVYKLILQLF